MIRSVMKVGYSYLHDSGNSFLKWLIHKYWYNELCFKRKRLIKKPKKIKHDFEPLTCDVATFG